MLAHEQMVGFVRGTMPQPVPSVKMQTSAGPVLSELMATGDTIRSLVIPERYQRPGTVQALKDELGRAVANGTWDGSELRLTFPSYRPRWAMIGWLRDAYLVAFARFGYRYVFWRELQAIRAQIAEPSATLVEGFTAELDASAPSRNALLIVRSPAWLRSIWVQMGRRVVFLPVHEGDGVALYERLKERSSVGPELLSVTGIGHPWPHAPQHLLDFR
jgi:hypothetical protein